jgi:2-polyprenyl-6-methoxyphenol hydroxylase-like FAD-dependent oxidoreductase
MRRTNMSRGKAIIVGAGLGGMCAALELRRAGFEPLVLERRSELGEVNTGLSLWAFAIRRLADLGLSQPEAFGSPIERLVHRSAGDRALTDLPVPGAAGALSYDVHRGELQRRLAGAVGDERIQLGRRCVSVADSDRGVEARLEDGSTEAGDVLIGADGVASGVREQVAGPFRLRRQDIGVWRGIAALGEQDFPRGLHLRYLGERGLFGIGRLTPTTVRWYAGAPFPDARPSSGEEAKSLALATFEGWPGRVRDVLERTPADDYLFNDTPHARPFRAWGRGRITLLGDAAHPMLPTLGIAGGVAIEDAAALGECLRDGEPVAALRSYERRRRPVARRVTLAAAAFERTLMLGGPAASVRDLGFRVAPQRLVLRWLTAGGRLRSQPRRGSD